MNYPESLQSLAYTVFRVAGTFSLMWRDGITEHYLGSHPVRKLNVGCGRNVMKGWLNGDLNPFRANIYLDATQRLPFRQDTFHYIFSEHLIEHLKYEEGRHLLRECFRVMKPKGKIRIATPDFDFLIRLRSPEKSKLQEEYIRWATEQFQPPGTTPNEVAVINHFFRAWGHQFIYDLKTLEASLKKAGFSKIQKCPVNESEDFHLKGIEWHGKVIGDAYNGLETLVLEAVKS